MAEQTRVHGFNNFTVGTLYYTGAVKAYLIDTGVDLRTEDDAVDEAVEAILRECNPLAYFGTDDANGYITVICDSSASGAGDLQAKIRQLGDSVGTGGVDLTSTTVVAASSITAA